VFDKVTRNIAFTFLRLTMSTPSKAAVVSLSKRLPYC